MIRPITSTPPPKLREPWAVPVSYLLGLVVTALAVAQMVSFEDFVAALGDYNLTGERGAIALAVTLVTLEVFAVPFLMRLHLSVAARWLSALFALIIPIFWTLLGITGVASGANIENSGLFGGFLRLNIKWAIFPVAVWLVLVLVSFAKIGGGKALRPKG